MSYYEVNLKNSLNVLLFCFYLFLGHFYCGLYLVGSLFMLLIKKQYFTMPRPFNSITTDLDLYVILNGAMKQIYVHVIKIFWRPIFEIHMYQYK